MSATDKPSAAMMTVAVELANFIAGGGHQLPGGIFARDVTIIENFPPYIFRDPRRWAAAMQVHLQDASELQCAFGEAQDFSVDGNTAYFALPTRWTGQNGDVPFSETGGWALVLRHENDAWRLAGYGWAVIDSASDGPLIIAI